jgi:hypothetical protein
MQLICNCIWNERFQRRRSRRRVGHGQQYPLCTERHRYNIARDHRRPFTHTMKLRLLTTICLMLVLVLTADRGHTAVNEMVDAKEYRDRHDPFIEQGQEPPGRWAPDERPGGALTWRGQLGWRTSHGLAIVRWSTGKPSDAENALYPDGSRGEANDTLDHGFRRRASGERLWIYGRIDIRPDDVVFIDGEQPIYQPPPQGDIPNLEADLARDGAFVAAIKDDRFALAVRTVFDNRSFYKGQDPRSWVSGERSAAALVANLRDRGESYNDYYPRFAGLRGTYPDDRPDIEQRLQTRIDEISKSLTIPLGVPLEALSAWLGPGEHSAEEVRQAMAAMQPWLERRRAAENETRREQQRAALEKAQRDLASFRDDHTNEDVFEALRAHLSRLGWRTETEQDRRRAHQEWVERTVQLLHEVKELGQRPEATPEAWAVPLRSRGPIFGGVDARELKSMSTDVRAVESGEVERRLIDLALTGRVSEQEYRVLMGRYRSLP